VLVVYVHVHLDGLAVIVAHDHRLGVERESFSGPKGRQFHQGVLGGGDEPYRHVVW